MLLPLITSGCTVPLDKFWDAILVYHDRPHLVNKKILGVLQAFFYKANFSNGSSENLHQLLTFTSIIYEVRRLPELSKPHLADIISNLLKPYDKNLLLTETDREAFRNSYNDIFLSLRILLPRHSACKRCVEVVLLDKSRNYARFYAVAEKNESVLAPPFPYSIELMNSCQVRLIVDGVEDAETNSADWLVDKLFSKLIKWADDGDCHVRGQQTLSLVPIDRYASLYQDMKLKYGQKLIKVWPENTDPLKFVYEDVAIAAYLICLWEKTDTAKKPTFVDLGCGNGLLVYILNQEGFPGYGIDVRKRKIWDLYPADTNLQVRTLIPSSASLFPEADWLIGNHSDELTPWIPVIATRSSQRTNFFLLPCCSYEFNGRKYARVNTSKSQYSDYMDYVREICRRCGFVTETDKLRIPSTKKTCIVSFGRTYATQDYTKIDEELTNFINKNGRPDSVNWVGNFEAREQVEKVRNCTRLNRELVTRIIRDVVDKLLGERNLLRKQDGQDWNAGIALSFGEVVTCVSAEDLKQLKNECGGLQTLLRNHRYIFEVVKGTVTLRTPCTVFETSKYKDKPCWFTEYHPDGCLHDSETCGYKHS